jgi:hypothetical protein
LTRVDKRFPRLFWVQQLWPSTTLGLRLIYNCDSYGKLEVNWVGWESLSLRSIEDAYRRERSSLMAHQWRCLACQLRLPLIRADLSSKHPAHLPPTLLFNSFLAVALSSSSGPRPHSSNSSIQLQMTPYESLPSSLRPTLPLSKSVFTKHNHVVDINPSAARVPSGSALLKAFPVHHFRRLPPLFRHTKQEQHQPRPLLRGLYLFLF